MGLISWTSKRNRVQFLDSGTVTLCISSERKKGMVIKESLKLSSKNNGSRLCCKLVQTWFRENPGENLAEVATITTGRRAFPFDKKLSPFRGDSFVVINIPKPRGSSFKTRVLASFSTFSSSLETRRDRGETASSKTWRTWTLAGVNSSAL